MGTKFVLSGLAVLLTQTLRSGERTLVFEVPQGRGRFVFMMFLAEEDIESRDKLFIFLRNTKVLLELDLYGSYSRGGTHTYLKPDQVRAIIDELQLGVASGVPFELDQFLMELNARIPPSISVEVIVDSFRDVWPEAKGQLRHVVDDSLKTTLIGIRRLPQGQSPREKTLRKLYLHTNGRAAEVASLIRSLKAARITLAWSADPIANSKTFADIASQIASGT